MGRFIAAGVGLGCLMLAGTASAQVAISARSGMINYIEGTVLLDGSPVTMKHDSFPQIRKGSEFRTEEGRAEVLLAPGVFMRLGENSAVRLLSDDIMDTGVEFLGGSVVVETADMAKDQALTFTMNGGMIGLLNKGLYRLDGEPPQVSVYDGEAWVTVGGQVQILKRGRRLRLDGVAVAEKFDTKTGDALFRWARRRSEYLAAANVSAAISAQRSGYSGTNSSWMWNPFYGTYTFLPMWGLYNSFWGSQFYPPWFYGGFVPTQPVGPTKPGSPTKGPIRPGPPRPPGHPVRPRPSDTGGQMAWRGRSAGPSHVGASVHAGVSHSIGTSYSGGSHPSAGSYSGGGHSSGGGYSGGGYSGGGGHSSGGGYSGGGGGGYSGGGGGHSSGGGGYSGGGGASTSGGGAGGNAGGGRSR